MQALPAVPCCPGPRSHDHPYRAWAQSVRSGWWPVPCGAIKQPSKDNDTHPSGAHSPLQLSPSWAFLPDWALLSLLSQLKRGQFIRHPSPCPTPRAAPSPILPSSHTPTPRYRSSFRVWRSALNGNQWCKFSK